VIAIVTSNYHPKRASKKIRPRTYPADMPLIATPAPMKKRQGPVIRLSEQQQASDNGQERQRALSHR
jgi:hypothetical protein